MDEKQWCEECQELHLSAYRRPELGGRILCNRCYYKALRECSPTGLVRQPSYLRAR